MERNIPDVRDIFGRQSSQSSARLKPELRSYEYSPRSRRRQNVTKDYDFADDRRLPNRSIPKDSSSAKNPAKFRDSIKEDLKDPKAKIDKEQQRNTNNKNRDSSHYSTRTLTERDIRHLERHLSMKKTIRKQISRNLAQAFVEDPDIVLKDTKPIPVQTKEKPTPDRSFTLTRAKVSKSEQNVLELLKENEPDSGHCSADNHCSSDDEVIQDDSRRQFLKSDRKPGNTNRSENRTKKEQTYKEDGKFSSFWKMFSVKNKGKR